LRFNLDVRLRHFGFSNYWKLKILKKFLKISIIKIAFLKEGRMRPPEDLMRRWDPYALWEVLPEEGYVLGCALMNLWDHPELFKYFDEFQAWLVAFKSHSNIAPTQRDFEFLEALTRIALEKLSDLPSEEVIGDLSVSEHRRILRNFRARNLGIED
jgi:hypothetical protein